MPDLGLEQYLLVSAAMFSLGIGVVVARRNAIVILCGLELMLNGAALNFAAMNHYAAAGDRLDGQMFTVFIIILAAAEAAIALGILLNLYHQNHSVLLDEADQLRD